MSRFKFQAFQKEFPFAFERDEAKEVDSIHVSRLDETNVSSIRGDMGDYGNSIFTRAWDISVSMYRRDGEPLGVLAQSHTIGSIGVQHQPDATNDGQGESLAEWGLAHHDLVDDVHYVVVRSWYHSSGSISDAGSGLSYEIRNPPRGHTPLEFVDRAMTKAIAEVQAESTF